MNIELRLCSWKLQFIFQRYQKVYGVNSDLDDGSHFLMWDFDQCELSEVLDSLREVQRKFRLPNIYVIQTDRRGSYHAYCFAKKTWAEAVFILMSTRHCDQGFIKLAVLRGYITLRITPKRRKDGTWEGFRRVAVLPSDVGEEVDPGAIYNFVEYWTKR